MPIYSYYCKSCRKYMEGFNSIANMDTYNCIRCNKSEHVTRQVTAPAFMVPGAPTQEQRYDKHVDDYIKGHNKDSIQEQKRRNGHYQKFRADN